MKRLMLAVALLVGGTAACGAADVTSLEGNAPPPSDRGGDGDPTSGAGGAGPTGPEAPPDVSQGDPGAVAGVLTAGIWDDNLNYDRFTTYRDGLSLPGMPAFTPEEQDAAELVARERQGSAAIDVAIVLDTTGSMGDEIAYLQAELSALAERLSELYPEVPQRWALVAYRDQGDDYVVRSSDLTAEVAAIEGALDELEPGGGGDYPEAPELALEKAAALSWSPQAGRIVFWVADAPHHGTSTPRMAGAVRALRDAGVHVYPVAASGADDLTEYTMRAAAQLTQGRYVFLTDDSGVGNAHAEPHIPCYWVTRLDHAMERAVRSEIEGERVEIDPGEVIRAVGEPVDGQCTPENGTVTYVF